jgi:hypothetical protein
MNTVPSKSLTAAMPFCPLSFYGMDVSRQFVFCGNGFCEDSRANPDTVTITFVRVTEPCDTELLRKLKFVFELISRLR